MVPDQSYLPDGIFTETMSMENMLRLLKSVVRFELPSEHRFNSCVAVSIYAVTS